MTSYNENFINLETLLLVLNKMLGKKIIHAHYQLQQLQGGTVGVVRLVTGIAETANGENLPYQLVWKTQKKFERYGDPGSWRREYDLYASGFEKVFIDSFRCPICYHVEINADEIQLWMEYIDGVSGLNLTIEMYECIAEELGRFQGRLYTEQPDIVQNLSNLSNVAFTKNHYLRYRSWLVLYDYIRTDNCEIPKHLCEMLIGIDNKAEELFNQIEKLPVVLCHRDFWVANIFYSDSKIVLIDWDTAGWGYMGEDIASLIADEADICHMIEYYQKCIPAYERGFSEYVDVSSVKDIYVYERILLMFGYRLVEWYKLEKSPDALATLEKIYEMKNDSILENNC